MMACFDAWWLDLKSPRACVARAGGTGPFSDPTGNRPMRLDISTLSDIVNLY